MKITTAGRLLTASADDRTLRYLLLPYDEAGSTNVGKVTASAGSVAVPDDPAAVLLNIEHDGTRPVGRAALIEDTPAGLEATFTVARTRAGDDLLEEAREGLRASASVEIDNPVIRAGRLVAGALTGAAAVVRPAFPSAQLVAADAGELPDYLADQDSETETTETVVVDGVEYVRKTRSTYSTETSRAGDDDDPAGDDETEDTPEPDTLAASAAEADPTITEDETMGDSTATVPAGSLAARSRKTNQHAAGADSRTLFARLAEAQGNPQMMAALADIIPANALGIEQPQYVGELWDGKAYQRKLIPLFNHGDLTSFTVHGWRWVTKPSVAPYDGDKTAVPSNAVQTEPVDVPAERIAGAHDIDRKFRDFNDTAFFASYYAAMTESYAKVSDAAVLSTVLAAATPVVAGTVPTGVASGWVSIIDGALSVLNETDTMPTFAVVATDVWREIVLTREQDRLAYLNAAMGLEDGSIGSFSFIPSAALPATQVLVGARDAATVHELGGTAPIRVEALDITNGGIDAGVFGYYAVNVHDASGLAVVTPAPVG